MTGEQHVFQRLRLVLFSDGEPKPFHEFVVGFEVCPRQQERIADIDVERGAVTLRGGVAGFFVELIEIAGIDVDYFLGHCHHLPSCSISAHALGGA